MPVITRLTAGKRDPTRVNLYFDGKFEFALPMEIVLKQSLKVNLTLTQLELSTLRSMGSEEKLFSKILNFLSYRPRSRKEIVDRLKRYLYKQDNKDITIVGIIEILEELGYIDDEVFATWFVESRMGHNPRSARYLTSELMQKGIDRSVITSVVSQLSNNTQALTVLLDKKSHLEEHKLIAYLSRRGFSYQEIKTAIANHTSRG